MSKFYRVTLADDDRPLVGNGKFMLGVRIGKPPKGDIELTERGTALPSGGGMSVALHWSKLPHFLIPPRLRHLVPTERRRSAAGNDNARCWRMGSGEFQAAEIGDRLILRIDSPSHGLIEPSNEMPIDSFQDALAETRDDWQIDEEP